MSQRQLEYINKEIYQVTSKLKLKHQVKFGKSNRDGRRLGPVYKSDFISENYERDLDLCSITVNTSDYLVLEYYASKDENMSIYLSYPHLFNFKRILRESLKWFYSNKYEDLYIYDKEQNIEFNSKYKKLRFETDITIGQRTFSIKPAIVQRHDIYEEGVIIILDSEYSVSLDVSELESLYDIINNFDLYNSSLILMNYALTTNPEELLANMSSSTSTKQTRRVPDNFQRKHKRKVINKD